MRMAFCKFRVMISILAPAWGASHRAKNGPYAA